MKDIEKFLGLPEVERYEFRKIFLDLYPNLVDRWVVVGGLPRRMYLAENGRTWPWPFNDLDIAAPKESVLSETATREFFITHHHRASENFYFQMRHKEHFGITIDIFQDHWGLRITNVKLFGKKVMIPTPEEMFLFTIRDILELVDHPRGLPPKHLEMFHFFREITDRALIEDLWSNRHQNAPAHNNTIYLHDSFEKLIAVLEKAVKEKAAHIKQWTKSDPFAPCSGCVIDSRFPLLRDNKKS